MTGQGHPFDPRNSAPELVAAASAHHGLSEDAATEPLLAQGLLLQAQRSGAGRNSFLPGGWLPAVPGAKAMENWKAPA
ncbi:hypothetical protein [Corynebacterium sp. A21]|uniref:hypothetical protein n=1 Tax=Corynebacterium sp. A21 TaxID=3457318 RepID=UPI003FD14A28